MPKMLSINDFDFGAIGPTFELDEVTPKFATETRTDEKRTSYSRSRKQTKKLLYR